MSSAENYTIRTRRLIEVNTDPQRRCYNGCHFSSELRWSDWVAVNVGTPADRVEARLKFWRELNAYAVSQRGDGAKAEFEAVLEVPDEL